MTDSKLNVVVAIVDKFTSQFDNLNNKIKSQEKTFKTMAIAGTAAFAAITGAVALSIKGASQAEVAQVRLAQILKTTNGATQDQINVLLKQADALELVGVVSGEAINIAQGTLATFDLQTDSIEKLIPAFLNMAVAEKGVNVTTDDMIGLANGLGKVLQGQVGALSRQGFVFDEVTAKILKNGTETEKVTALAEILNSTYAGMNETMRATAAGGVAGLQMSLGKLADNIGTAFLPVVNEITQKLVPLIEKIAKWAEENPKLTSTIIIVAGAIAGLAVVVGTLGLAIPAIVAGFIALSAVIGAITAPIALVVAGVGLLATAWANDLGGIQEKTTSVVDIVKTKMGDFATSISTEFSEISKTASETWTKIMDDWRAFYQVYSEELTTAWEVIKLVFLFYFEQIKLAFVMLWEGIKLAFIVAWEIFSGLVKTALELLQGDWKGAWEAFSGIFIGIWEGISDAFNNVWEGIKNMASNVLDGITSKVKNLMTTVIDLINKLPLINIPGGSSSSSKAQKKANGGFVTPLYASDGIFVPQGTDTVPAMLTPGELVLNKAQQRNVAHAIRGGGQKNIIINITGNTLLDEDAGEKIGDMIVKRLSMNLITS